MATLTELWRAVVPAARPIGPLAAGSPGPERPIAWVRVLKPRVPAFDALEEGDLAIVPASALAIVAPGEAELAGLVEAFARASVAGVLIVEAERTGGEAVATLADALAHALAAAGLPGLRVERADPAGLERSAISYLVNRRAELERQAAELERQLERLALVGGGPAAFAAAIGAFLGRPVAIERRRGDPIAVHAPPDQPAALAAVARYHARPAAVGLRVPLPAGDGRPIGSLVVLDEGPLGERERVACERVATLLALELARGAGGLRGAGPASGDRLPAAGPPWVVYVARQGVDVAGADTLERREALRGEVRLLAGPGRLILRGDAASLELRAVAAAPADDPDGLLLAGRIAERLHRPVAVSRRFVEPTGRPVAEAEARATLEVVERLADPPAVARADRLPAYRLLASLPDLPDGLRQARALLEPLLVGRPALQRQRLDTLRAVLDRDLAADAASALGVHRNTIAYRMRRIEQLGGWNLADPELRLALSIAVRLVQYAQVSERER
ncbi:MAG: PucR family transcriptional regulator [Chloroflexota bacterium]